MFDFLKLSDKKENSAGEKKSKYELAQQDIKELTVKAGEHKQLESVSERGLIFAHKVTGKELNSITAHIDDTFIKAKNVQIEILQHIMKLYQALDALDEEHIAGILAALKAAEAATDSARTNDENIGMITDYLMDDDRVNALKEEQDKKMEALEKKLKTANAVAMISLAIAVVSVLVIFIA